MKISRIYITVDGVDYRLLGSELNIELDLRVRELILKGLLTSKINHIERDKKMSPPPQKEDRPAVADKVASPSTYSGQWRYHNDLLISNKLERHEYVTHDRSGKRLNIDSKRLNLNLRTKDLICKASNSWVKRNELSDELFRMIDIGLSKSSIKVYLTDLEKIGFLESAVDKDLNKCVRINEELYKA